MEFESDDDVDKQVKNSSDAKVEEKVQVRKKTVHNYEISSDEEEGKRTNLKKIKKTQDGDTNQQKMMKMIRLLCQMK